MEPEELSFAIPVVQEMDPGASRTNQCAELLAAIEGLNMLHLFNVDGGDHTEAQNHEDGSTYIVVSDSEYVVKGITEWFPTWKNWKTSEGKRPTDLDLFLKLDNAITSLENDSVAVGFLHVPREFNHKVDALAKRAAAEDNFPLVGG